jgi:hypothetical protein
MRIWRADEDRRLFNRWHQWELEQLAIDAGLVDDADPLTILLMEEEEGAYTYHYEVNTP